MQWREANRNDIERCVAYAPAATHVPRHPIEYTPGSATVVNAARLPSRNELAGMALAHRERVSDNDLAGRALSVVTLLPSGLLLLVLVGFSLARFLPPAWAIIGTAGLSFAMLMRVVVKGRLQTSRIAIALFGPPAVVILGYALSSIVDNRLLITGILGALSIGCFLLIARKLTEFYWGWLNAHPRLMNTQRAQALRDNPLKPTLWVPFAAILIALFVPLVSTSLAIIAIVALCLGWCLRTPGQWHTLMGAPKLLGLYLASGELSSGTPGVWMPDDSPTTRRWQVRIMAGLLFFSLGFGLRYYFPSDLIRGPVAEQIALAVPSYPPLRGAFPGVDWTKLPAPAPAGATIQPPELRRPSHDSAERLPDEEERIARLNRWRLEQYYQALSEDAKFREQYRLDVASEFLDKEIGDRPYTWVIAAAAGIVNNQPLFAWTFPAAFVIALIVPNLVLLATYRDAIVRGQEYDRKLNDDSAAMWIDDKRTPWQWRVDRLLHSEHVAHDPLTDHQQIREAGHMFLGIEPYWSFPVLLDRSLLNQHCYIVGETGSGKTSLGIMPLLLQLLQIPEPSQDSKSDESGEPARDEQPPIIILDLKGDPALFNLAKQEAERRRERNGVTDPKDPRYAFRYFTPEPNRATHYFNPFRSMQSKNRSVMQLCELLMESLALAHGEGYGRSYYTRKAREQLLSALTREPAPASIGELYEDLKERKGNSETFELVATLAALSMYENLATDDKRLPETETIHMPTALENRQVVYFWLPAATESVSVREIGKLALYSLLTAAIDRDRDSSEKRDTYLFIDEFQRLAGENFKIVLEQARSFGLHAILANQSLSDLKTQSADLRPTIQTNTRVKMYFSVTDPNVIKDLSFASGEEMMYTTSVGKGFQGNYWTVVSENTSPTVKPRMTTTDIVRSSDHPLEFILKVSQGSGYTQFAGMPIPVQCPWPISWNEYTRLSAIPWPERVARQPKITKTPKDIDTAAQTEKQTQRGLDIASLVDELAAWSGAQNTLDDA